MTSALQIQELPSTANSSQPMETPENPSNVFGAGSTLSSFTDPSSNSNFHSNSSLSLDVDPNSCKGVQSLNQNLVSSTSPSLNAAPKLSGLSSDGLNTNIKPEDSFHTNVSQPIVSVSEKNSELTHGPTGFTPTQPPYRHMNSNSSVPFAPTPNSNHLPGNPNVSPAVPTSTSQDAYHGDGNAMYYGPSMGYHYSVAQQYSAANVIAASRDLYSRMSPLPMEFCMSRSMPSKPSENFRPNKAYMQRWPPSDMQYPSNTGHTTQNTHMQFAPRRPNEGDLSNASSSGPASESSDSDEMNQSRELTSRTLGPPDVRTACPQRPYGYGAHYAPSNLQHTALAYNDSTRRSGRARKPNARYDYGEADSEDRESNGKGGGTLAQKKNRRGQSMYYPAYSVHNSSGSSAPYSDASQSSVLQNHSMQLGQGYHDAHGYQTGIPEETPYGLQIKRTYSNRTKSADSFYAGYTRSRNNRQATLRQRRKVRNYAEMEDGYETDEQEKVIEKAKEANRVQGSYVQGVDRIIGHRTNSETGDMEYCIKWKCHSHLHNSWETYSVLQSCNGIKKVDNYIKKCQVLDMRRQLMTPDEIEQEDISIELARQLDEDALIAERIVDSGPPGEDGSETFLVKWRSNAYDQCTWEYHETLVKYKFDHLITQFQQREERLNIIDPLVSILPQHINRTKFEPYLATPWYLTKANEQELRDYQILGVNWMISRMKRGLSVLLADEMGLGKTVQTISVVGHMLYTEKLVGPFLIIVPQSTLDNWMNEFARWLPQANVVCYHGNAASRDILRFYEFRQVNVAGIGKRWRFDVCITSPSILNSQVDVDFLRNKVVWQLMVVDEAHQLKNRTSKRFQELQQLRAVYRLLLSGTPLHNNLEELWSLLHFMNPIQCAHYADFQRKYPDIENTNAIGESKQRQLNELQAELHEVALRRVKKDVEKSLPNKVESILRIEMSPIQVDWYKAVLTRNYEHLTKSSGGAKVSLQNICMELKKVCNHPFLCHLPDEISAVQQGLIHGSGKMCLLDKLLFRLKEKGHRVLIFSQMVRMLNILSDYMTQKGFKHQRLDGSMNKELRKKAMDHFNEPDSDDFCFLLSTKAGGLGINLTSADTVIIYDSDWNPQNDLQAEARAHRIGQKKTVQIYRLVTRDSIEQNILERAKAKLVLDTLVVQGLNKKHDDSSSLFQMSQPTTAFSREELAKILQFGASKLWSRNTEGIVNAKGSTKGLEIDLDKVLEEAEVTITEKSDIADDLLSSYNNISEFRYEPPPDDASAAPDKDFWETIIPLNDRLNFQRDKQEELLVTGPRKTRAKDGFAKRGTLDEDFEDSESESFVPERRVRRGKRNDRKLLSDRDKFKLYRSLLKYGDPVVRVEDIQADTRLQKYDKELIIKEAQMLVLRCQKKLQEIGYNQGVEIDDIEESYNGASEELDRREGPYVSRHFIMIGDAKANAHDLIERVELLTVLDQFMKRANPGHTEPWKLPTGPLPCAGRPNLPVANGICTPPYLQLELPNRLLVRLKDWTAKDVRDWGAEQDVNLVKGTYVYGFGSWTEVHLDPNLNLEQIRDIKYDKVKMRSLRILKLIDDVLLDSRSNRPRRPRTAAANGNPDRSLDEKNESDGEESSTMFQATQGTYSSSVISGLTDNSPSVCERNVSNDVSLCVEAPVSSRSITSNLRRRREPILEADAATTKKRVRKHSRVRLLDCAKMTDEEVAHLARKALKPLRKNLKSMKRITLDTNCTDDEVIQQLKHSLPLVGEELRKILLRSSDPISASRIESACWEYVSKFTIASADDLQRVCAQLQKTELLPTASNENLSVSCTSPEDIMEYQDSAAVSPCAYSHEETEIQETS